MIFVLTIIIASFIFLHYEGKRNQKKIRKILSIDYKEADVCDNLEKMLGGKK